MEIVRFRAKIELNGVNPFVWVSAPHAQRLRPEWRKPIPVLVRVNRKPREPWPINLMPAGDGRFYLYLCESLRLASATGVGDEVGVEVTFDASYRGGPADLPEEFAAALAKNARAAKGWAVLSPSRQKEVVRYLSRLKGASARASNIEKAMRALSGAALRFLGRTWGAKE